MNYSKRASCDAIRQCIIVHETMKCRKHSEYGNLIHGDPSSSSSRRLRRHRSPARSTQNSPTSDGSTKVFGPGVAISAAILPRFFVGTHGRCSKPAPMLISRFLFRFSVNVTPSLQSCLGFGETTTASFPTTPFWLVWMQLVDGN